jgi:AraC-like DNA-binding protein
LKDDKGQLIKLSVLNVLNEIMDSYSSGEVICENDTRYIFMLNGNTDRETENPSATLFAIMKNMTESMHIYFNISVSFGVSSVKSGYSNLIPLYAEADKQLECKFLYGPGIYVHGCAGENRNVLDEKKALLLGLCSFTSEKNEEFKQAYDKKILQLMGLLTNAKESVRVSFQQLLHWTLSQFESVSDGRIDLYNVSKSMDLCETIDEMIEVYRDFFLDLKAASRGKKVLGPEMEKSIQFIESHYQEDISVIQVAHHVNLSPNYFSSLFKREMHVNFTEYINDLRVDKARKLLLETYLKGYEIAEKVGFNDNTYFTRVFKKVTGSSPNEYRKKWLKGWTDEKEADNPT